MSNKRIRIPKKFIYVDRDFKTRAIQDEYGKMQGRKRVQGRGDSTAVFRVKKGHPRSGEIFGRTHPISVRGDEKKRGTIRRRLT